MYHISRSQSKEKPFQVTLVGKNGEPLNHHLLKTKQACFKNVAAQLSVTENPYSYVQDNTVKTPIVYKIHDEGGHHQTDDTHAMPPYIPGKNPVNKKK